MKRIVLSILLAMMLLPLVAQENGRTLPPNYCRIKKEIAKKNGPYCLDSLQARFDRCDTTLTVDDLRCLYYNPEGPQLLTTYQRYLRLQSRFGRHTGPVNDAWTRYQMLLTAIWSTGDGSRRRPLHVRSLDDSALIIASDNHGFMNVRTYMHRRYFLLQDEAQKEGDYDVWFYVRKMD